MDDNRNHIITVGIATAFVCIVLAGIMGSQLTAQNVLYDKQADHYIAEFASHTDQEVMQSCALASDLDLIRCLRDELKAERDTKRSEADLAAQQKVAEWSFGAVILAGLSLLFTAGGIWLVYLNLREARKVTGQSIAATNAAIEANRDTREQFALEHRPWLIFEKPRISADNSDGVLDLYVSIDVENIGKTPAMEAILHLEMMFTSSTVSDVTAVKLFGERCSIPTSEETRHKLIFPGKTRPLYEIAGDAPDPSLPFVRLLYCVSYRGSGFDRVLTTAGEALFSVDITDSSENTADPFVDIDRFTFYGTGYAT
jgi:hypothetical protein